MKNRLRNVLLSILCRMLAVEIEKGYEPHTLNPNTKGTTRLYALRCYIDYQCMLIEKDTNMHVEIKRDDSRRDYPVHTVVFLK